MRTTISDDGSDYTWMVAVLENKPIIAARESRQRRDTGATRTVRSHER